MIESSETIHAAALPISPTPRPLTVRLPCCANDNDIQHLEKRSQSAQEGGRERSALGVVTRQG
jgi:hypothetical protein